MMIVDHIAAGILLPHTMKSFQNAPAVAVSILAASLPDLPVVFSGWKGSIGYLSHRGMSHSMLLGLLFSLVPAAFVYFLFKTKVQNSFFELYLLATLSYLVHVFIDLITPYGTKILWPLSKKPYSLDLIHCFDPIVIGLSLTVITAFLINVFHKRLMGNQLVLILIGLYCVYGSVALIRKHHYSQKFRASISMAYSQTRFLRTIPRTFWRWKGIAALDSAYIVAGTNKKSIETRKYHPPTSLPSSIAADDYYRIFMEYARFPVMEMEGNVVAFHNLIYSPISYRLSFIMGKDQTVSGKEISGFELADKYF